MQQDPMTRAESSLDRLTSPHPMGAEGSPMGYISYDWAAARDTLHEDSCEQKAENVDNDMLKKS